jgi:glucose uptake protein
MIATLRGVFAWHEFRGANQKARLYLTGMFAAYLLALVLIARAYSG